MSLSDYSYLDLTVMPFLRKKVISGDAAILFNADFTSILWANAIGAELFGGEDIFSLLEIELSDNHPLIKQIRNASVQIDDTGSITRGFRVARGLKSDLVQGDISKITLPNDDKCVLLVFEGTHKSNRLREHELARIAVEALEGFADAAAIVDDYGLVLASTHGFDRYEIDPETLETLINIVSDEDDRLVKRKVQTASGKMAAAGLGRIRDTPGRFLVVIADAVEEAAPLVSDDDQAVQSSLDVNNHQTPLEIEVPSQIIDQLDPPIFDDAANDDETAMSDEELPAAEETVSTTLDDDPADLPVDTEAMSDEEFEPSDETLKAGTSGSLLDRWYFSEENQKANSEEGAVDPTKTSDVTDDVGEEDSENNSRSVSEVEIEAEAPVEVYSLNDELLASSANDPEAAPIRFAFSIDQNQVVQSVSSELTDAVGAVSGDINGKHWADIASARNFDENGLILSLLKKADTWSGKSIFWPIDNTDMVVPVDLAALPVYDRERNFEGFKGFGIIRMNDVVVDPSGTGYVIDDRNVEPTGITDDASTESTTSSDQASASYWKTDLSDEDAPDVFQPLSQEHGSDQSLAGNVFQLPRRDAANNDEAPEIVTDQGDESLSSNEQKAFSEISRSLADQIEDEHKANEAELELQSETTMSAEIPSSLMHAGSVLETLPVPLVIYHAEKTLFANQALLELAGYQSTEDLENEGGLEALLGSSTAREDREDGSAILVHKNGDEISVQSKLTSVDWHGEKALCLTFANQEASIADEKTALDMVRVSELENILETAADGILVIDKDGKIESLNSSGEALFGRDQQSVLGKSFGKLFASESRDALETYIKDLNTPGVSSVLNQGQQVIGIEANGGLIPLFATIGKVGKTNRYCAVLRDLTEWKKSEEELVTAKRNAETASEQKTEFLSRISHEIREPLTAIIGFSDVMIEERFGVIDNERYREYLKDINRSGIHVLDLVNDLLDISKIEAGKLELSYEAVDLNQLAAETVALLQPQANNKRILIRTSLSRAVPKVVADARSIRQIILNLVSNAINHSATNSQVIVSTTYEENSEVGLRIRDTGPGMSEEDLEKAIEPFAQVGEDHISQTGGTGLGLPLTKALVEANRAYFELESKVGEGTIAHIQFPSQRVLAD